MFEALRRHSNSLSLIVFVATLATAFGVGWGPGSQGCQQGSLRVTSVATIYGVTLADADFNSQRALIAQALAYQGSPFGEMPGAEGMVRQGALDGLIERELLAHEATRLGMQITDENINQEFRQCRVYFTAGIGAENALGIRSGPIQIRGGQCWGTGNDFDYQRFERAARTYFRRVVPELRESTRREMLADRMRQSVRASVQVSDEEMWQEYRHTHDQMAVRYLRFSREFYRLLAHEDDAARVTAWAGAHTEEINRQWERRRDSLRGRPREIHVRHILVRYPDNATDAQKAQARAKAEAIRQRVVQGEDFVRLARLYSDDPGSWKEGGELSWRQPDGPQGYVEAFTRAALALQPGQTSPVTETTYGVHVIQLLGVRQGDVSEADGKRDLARTLYREAFAEEQSRTAAQAALARLRTGANLETVARELNATALRDFYRGELPTTQTLAGGVTLSPVTRDNLSAPALEDSETFARNGSVVSDNQDSALTSAAFELTDAAPFVTAPVQSGDDWFVMRFKPGSRSTATREEFQRQRQELMATTYASMLAARQRAAVVQYVTRLRQEADHSQSVKIGNSPRLQPARADEEE